jgi:hypothetical protein
VLARSLLPLAAAREAEAGQSESEQGERGGLGGALTLGVKFPDSCYCLHILQVRNGDLSHHTHSDSNRAPNFNLSRACNVGARLAGAP